MACQPGWPEVKRLLVSLAGPVSLVSRRRSDARPVHCLGIWPVVLVRWAQSTPIRSQIDASVVVLQVKVTSNYLQDEILTDAARAALQRPRLRRLVVSRWFIYLQIHSERARPSHLFGPNLNIEISRVETRDTWSFVMFLPSIGCLIWIFKSAAEARKALIGWWCR